MNKKLIVVPFVALALAGLAGCGNKDSGGGQGGGTTKIYVKSGYGKGMQTRLTEYAKEFMILHPDVEIDVAQIQGSYEGVRSQTSADLNANNDTWGDLVCCYPDHVQEYKMTHRKAVDVNKFINSADPEIGLSQEVLSNFTDSALANLNSEFSFSGRYVLPYSSSSEALFYNPVLLDLTVPGINNGNKITREYMSNLTWEELFDVFCPKILEYNNSLPADKQFMNTTESKYAVCAYDSDDNLFITLAEQYGYGYTALDADGNPKLLFDDNETGVPTHQAEMEALLKKLSEGVDKHYFLTKGSNNDAFSSDLFKKGAVLLEIGSTAGLEYHTESFATEVTRIPTANGKAMKAINQGGSWCILSHNSADDEARQLAAWKFYKYLIEEDNILRWATESSGYAPILRSVYGTEDWADVVNEYDAAGQLKEGKALLTARTFNTLSTITNNLFVNVVFNGSSACRTAVGGLVASILNVENITAAKVHELFNQSINNIRTNM